MEFICLKTSRFNSISLILVLIIFTSHSTLANNFYKKLASPSSSNLIVDEYSTQNQNDYENDLTNSANQPSIYSDEDENRNNFKGSADFLVGRDSNSYREKKTLKLRDLLQSNQKSRKRGFQIQTYFDALIQKDGSILLIPKDVNKNHYFIG